MFEFSIKTVGGGPTCQSLFFTCVKKSNQKKAHNLTKIDPDITYSLWGGFIQYTLAALRKRFSLDLVVRQYLSSPPANIILIPQTFQNTMRLQRTSSVELLFILKQVKTVPNGRLLLLSSACRSKKIRKEKE